MPPAVWQKANDNNNHAYYSSSISFKAGIVHNEVLDKDQVVVVSSSEIHYHNNANSTIPNKLNNPTIGHELDCTLEQSPYNKQQQQIRMTSKAGGLQKQLLSRYRNLSHPNCYYFTGLGDRPCVCPTSNPDDTPPPKTWGIPASSEVNVFYYQNDIPFDLDIVEDHSWVEVMRWKEWAGKDRQGDGDGGRYGTWFFAMPGSGISVNIGKAIRFSNRKE
eukprot:CAMPEP_0194257592 /NCGR_PEP_ID=MMETSP0158-20130606/39415_1 /TAXON_ID=33649 /ORGANISM="Thalassionema nitzschioides, Strain L26-B" /LENGTH=217 /DNA_ID=CAMNT_0038996693 /DNA_START=39 /DNA_END=689 /DNA_ORIENTATION=+